MSSNLDRWLATFSRGTLASVAIAAGILFIILNNPPQTVCDVQVNFFKDQQKSFLFVDETLKPVSRITKFTSMSEYCERGNSPGACYEYFARLRSMIRDLETVPKECEGRIAGISEVNMAVWRSVDLMIRLAWGSRPPQAYREKFNWLDVADVALFCSLQTQIERFYGKDSWANYREKLFHELPGAKDLPRAEAWEKLLLSEDCRRFQ